MSKYKLQQTQDKNDVHIYSIDLAVTYNAYGNLIELKQGTNETSTFELSILDKQMDNHTCATTIDFCASIELINIIKDFQEKINKLTK